MEYEDVRESLSVSHCFKYWSVWARLQCDKLSREKQNCCYKLWYLSTMVSFKHLQKILKRETDYFERPVFLSLGHCNNTLMIIAQTVPWCAILFQLDLSSPPQQTNKNIFFKNRDNHLLQYSIISYSSAAIHCIHRGKEKKDDLFILDFSFFLIISFLFLKLYYGLININFRLANKIII